MEARNSSEEHWTNCSLDELFVQSRVAAGCMGRVGFTLSTGRVKIYECPWDFCNSAHVHANGSGPFSLCKISPSHYSLKWQKGFIGTVIH